MLVELVDAVEPVVVVEAFGAEEADVRSTKVLQTASLVSCHPSMPGAKPVSER